MNNRDLCIRLIKTDTEAGVIELLGKAGYWGDSNAWKYYGGNEDNFGTIGNQQDSADAALAEKITNSVDAMLMRECLRTGISPESKSAPQSTEKAIQRFFGVFNGKLSSLDAHARAKLADGIALVAVGQKTNPSYIIIDRGEGQTPAKMPQTLVSLSHSNKLRIPFVQGKYNMGGTGALRFCGEHSLQLIVSKRDPAIAKSKRDGTEDFWGFTIVRRESYPGMRSSTFEYLAPKGKIAAFEEKSISILPGEYPEAYSKPFEWGSLVKLYEYQLIGGLRAPVYFDLYYKLSLLLPNIPLPIRMYERRKGYKATSYHIVMSGLSVRLDEDKSNNLEPGFPNSCTMKIRGREMKILIYVFKRGKKERYSSKEGIIFTVNGQSHGFWKQSFFSRKVVGMDYLADSILVVVDCSEFDNRTREDFLMPSRDRQCQSKLRTEINGRLQELLRNHPGLKDLRIRRIQEDAENRLQEAKPLAEVIEKVIKKSPVLSRLLIQGARIQNPFNLTGAKEKEVFNGKKFPTFFKLRETHSRSSPKICPINRRFRVQFETDAENEYFTRDLEPGQFTLSDNGTPAEDFVVNLWNGIANLNVSLPKNVKPGEILSFRSEVSDISHTESFHDDFYVSVDRLQDKRNGGNGHRKKPSGTTEGKERQKPSLLALPEIIEVRKDEWEKYRFDRESALLVKDTGIGGYYFYINIDNNDLQRELKTDTSGASLLKECYVDGMVFIGLALLQEFESSEKEVSGDETETVYEKISKIAKAMSPFLLPMIVSLGETIRADSRKNALPYPENEGSPQSLKFS